MRLKSLCLTFAALLGCSAGNQSVKVTQSEYGDRWPFTVTEGELDCLNRADVVLRVNGEVYAINGTARNKTAEYKDLGEIWRDQPDHSEGKVPIPSEMIERGRAICSPQ